MNQLIGDPLDVGHRLASEVVRTSEVVRGRCSVCFTSFSSDQPGKCVSEVLLPASRGTVLAKVESLLSEPLYMESPLLCDGCFSLIFKIDDLEGRLAEAIGKFCHNYRDRHAREAESFEAEDELAVAEPLVGEFGRVSVARNAGKHTVLKKRIKRRTSGKRRTTKVGDVETLEVQSRRKTKEIWAPLFGFYCDVCCADYRELEDYTSHYNSTHPGLPPFSCAECSEKTNFMHHEELVTHEAAVHGGSGPEWRMRRNRRCRFCLKKFSCAETLKRHLVMVHMQEKMEFECEECERRFVTRVAMETHVKRDHLNVREYGCSGHCSKRFPTERALKEHLYQVRKREEAGVNLKLCPECGKGLKTERQLRDHLRVIHENQRDNHPCEHCGKVYTWIADKKRHVRIAHGGSDYVSPHACSECDKRFQSKAALRQHLRREHNVLDESLTVFKCNECDKEFFSKAKLSDHSDVHVRQRKLTCVACNIKFKTLKAMDDHVLRSHAAKSSDGPSFAASKFEASEEANVDFEIEGFKVVAASPGVTEFAVALPEDAIVTPDGIYVVVRGTTIELPNISA